MSSATSATASVVDVSRTLVTNENENRGRNNSGQCLPMPLPALGTQRIIQGNGTNVGTVISLQCPARHRLVGGGLVCVMGTNSTQWTGDTPWCKPVAPFDDFGFRVAVLASIVSSTIILLMSMAFITSCLVDCLKKEERKKQERETGLWHQLEPREQRENLPFHYSHKGRNNNNNTTQEKALSLQWDNRGPALCDSRRPCRCHQQYAYGPTAPPSTSTFSQAPPSVTLPGRGIEQPLLPQHSGRYQNHQNPALPHYLSPSRVAAPNQNSGRGLSSGQMWQNAAQKESGISGVSWPPQEDSQRIL
ncbi:uncharacterized protein susd3 [Aplochiton taeniatus]